MGKVVAAFGQSHLMLSANETQRERESVFDGNKEIGECIRNARPDVLLVISGDHKFNDLKYSLGVGVAETYTPCGDLRNPKDPFKGCPEFGLELLEYVNKQGLSGNAGPIDENFHPDHSFAVPVMFTTPHGTLPTVPIVIPLDDIPEPTVSYHEHGRILREFIENERLADERVAVIASGGLSHWVFLQDPLMDFEPDPNATVPGVNENFDREVLELFSGGRAQEFADTWDNTRIFETAGNGALELNYWLMMAAVLPRHRGRTIYYEPLSAWGTGMGAVEIFPEKQ